MYNFRIMYVDKSYVDIDDVKSVVHPDFLGNAVNVQGDELLTHEYPLTDTLHFICDSEACVVAGKEIKSIHVTKKP